ncbi:MAG: acylneuraminate cytidylyltransferase family protein, partial [Saprospiraceae bacterium]
LWTHVTSPFINENDYEAIIKQYYTSLEKGYDSLMTVMPLHKFLWNEDTSINYDRAIEKWPRTQTLTPVYEVNSAVFLANATIYRKEADRIGKHPFLYATDEQKSYDIDWEINFRVAEMMWQAQHSKLKNN